MIYGHSTDRLKLQTAKLQSDPSKCALQLMSCIFSPEELVNGNPSCVTNSKDEVRRKTIKQLDPMRMKYISGRSSLSPTCIVLSFTLNRFRRIKMA